MSKKTLIVLAAALGMQCTSTERSAEASDSDTTSVVEYDSLADRYEEFLKIEAYQVDEDQIPSNDLMTIDSACALIVNPTAEQLERMEEESGEEDFATIVDDYSYYQSTAVMTLDSLGIKTRNADKRYVKFVAPGGGWTIDLRKEGAPEWNLIFFMPGRTPAIMTAIDVTRDSVNAWFK